VNLRVFCAGVHLSELQDIVHVGMPMRVPWVVCHAHVLGLSMSICASETVDFACLPACVRVSTSQLMYLCRVLAACLPSHLCMHGIVSFCKQACILA
jgi:hypothetical protein